MGGLRLWAISFSGVGGGVMLGHGLEAKAVSLVGDRCGRISWVNHAVGLWTQPWGGGAELEERVFGDDDGLHFWGAIDDGIFVGVDCGDVGADWVAWADFSAVGIESCGVGSDDVVGVGGVDLRIDVGACDDGGFLDWRVTGGGGSACDGTGRSGSERGVLGGFAVFGGAGGAPSSAS